MELFVKHSISFNVSVGDTNCQRMFRSPTKLMSFKKGQITAIAGPSGCGKSTFIKHILGLNATENRSSLIQSVYLNKEDRTLKPSDLKDLAYYLPQDISILSMSAEVNISLCLDPRLWNIDNLINSVERVGFEFSNFKKRFEIYSENSNITTESAPLSGGEKKRIGLARALYKNPHFLFLDEPTAGLDKNSENLIIRLLCHLKTTRSIVVITHSDEVLKAADIIYSFVQPSSFVISNDA